MAAAGAAHAARSGTRQGPPRQAIFHTCARSVADLDRKVERAAGAEARVLGGVPTERVGESRPIDLYQPTRIGIAWFRNAVDIRLKPER